jgi:hypothetical protein
MLTTESTPGQTDQNHHRDRELVRAITDALVLAVKGGHRCCAPGPRSHRAAPGRPRHRSPGRLHRAVRLHLAPAADIIIPVVDRGGSPTKGLGHNSRVILEPPGFRIHCRVSVVTLSCWSYSGDLWPGLRITAVRPVTLSSAA